MKNETMTNIENITLEDEARELNRQDEQHETEMRKEISRRILALTATGMSTKEAFNTVLGAGAFEKLAGEVYDTLKGGK